MKRILFNKSEIEQTGYYPPMMPGFPQAKKYNTPVTPKENYTALYKGEMPLWMPLANDSNVFCPKINPDNIARAFVTEVNPLKPEEMVGGKDMFGVDWVYIPQATGSMVKPGNPLMTDANDWEKHVRFPDIESWDWEGSAKANAELLNDGRAVTFAMMNGLFERLISFMDFENAVVALIDDDQKDAVHALLSRLVDLYISILDKAKKYYNPTIINFHDDWGSQRAPFFSIATAREMIVPYLKKVVDHVHSQGLFFDLHSCGKNELLVPAYIEAGIDSWAGAQTMNDKDMLYSQYGDKLIIGLDPDIEITPMTADEDAIGAAKRFIAKYGPTMAEKPFICATMIAHEAFTDTLYEESRKMFN